MKLRAMVVVVGVGACSTPTSPQPAPPRVEVHDAGPIDAQVTASISEADDDDDPPPDYRYRFEWQQRRDEYKAFLDSGASIDKCDFRPPKLIPTAHCQGPHEVAGRVIRLVGGSKPGTVGIIIDRGERDMITLDWTVALLDEEGHPLSSWVPIGRLRWDSESYAEVEGTLMGSRHNTHVGMRIDQQLLEAKSRLNHQGHSH